MNLKKKLVRYLQVNLLGPGTRLIKKELPGRGLTKVEKHYFKSFALTPRLHLVYTMITKRIQCCVKVYPLGVYKCQYMLSHYQISEDGDATTAVIFYTYYFTNYLFNYGWKLRI